MASFLKPFQSPIYGAFRVVMGFLFLCHGAQKIFGLFGGPHPELSTAMVWGAGLVELVGGACIALGLLTRWAAFVCSGQMAVAYFLVHQPTELLPIENRGELAALYCWAFLFVAAHGPGTWSLDKILGRS
jgi:putative oxidoreductase